jgi:hypothetical protein
MLSDVSLKRIAPLVLAAIATGVATIAAADPAAARSRNQERTEAPAPTLNGRAAIAVVSIKDQRVSLYDAEGGAVRARISSGQTGYETPVGVFSVLQKEVEHHSNLYDDASMPFMQRITWSGIALHAGVLPGYPASHGCVRLPYEFAQRIFSLTKLGLRVVISRDDIAPVAIAHPLLPKPAPVGEVAVATPTAYEPLETDDERATILEPDVRNWPARQALLDTIKAEAKTKAEDAKAAVTRWETAKAELKKHATEVALVAKRDRVAELKRKAEARLAKADKQLAEAKTPGTQKRAETEKTEAAASLATLDTKLAEATKAAEEAAKVLGPLNDEIAAAEAAKKAAVAAAAEARRKTLPVSIFVSAKSQKLYVRQGNEPVFDSQVAVADPDRPIGTHVFTALDYANGGNDVRWNVVTVSHGGSSGESFADDDWDDYGRRRKRAEKSSTAPPVTNAAAAAAALERVSIPADVRARISEYVWPGSSLIISDEELHKETGKATDFIVVASDEPQGALAKRKRLPPPSYYRDFYDDDYYFSYRPPYSRYDRGRPPRYKGGLFGLW